MLCMRSALIVYFNINRALRALRALRRSRQSQAAQLKFNYILDNSLIIEEIKEEFKTNSNFSISLGPLVDLVRYKCNDIY